SRFRSKSLRATMNNQQPQITPNSAIPPFLLATVVGKQPHHLSPPHLFLSPLPLLSSLTRTLPDSCRSLGSDCHELLSL
ncbi:hypothetical protein HAX54_030119, partial [Datura stramonium]|nr:hypothetical protein [Datura stramonium]